MASVLTQESRSDDAPIPSLSVMDGLRAVPPRVARHQGVIPLRFDGATLVAGTLDPRDLRALDSLRRLGHSDVRLERVSEPCFREIMESWYGPTADLAEFTRMLATHPAPLGESALGVGDDLDAAPAVRFVDLVLRAALQEGASDVHVEPDKSSPRVRFRVDGVLLDRPAPPPWLAMRVIARIKALAGLALGDCLYAQDGQLEFPTERGPVSVRVSTLPSDRGECAVLRLLAVESEIPSLERLGVSPDGARRLSTAAQAMDGVIIFAGPTGSGKTTSLHSLLTTVDGSRRNIVSIEEPVEIRARGVRQIPVRRETGLDFAGALRVVLRQDPDVILVGETRDTETAQLVVQAALAGHLVLTTVHASNAIQVFDRFAQLGADRALLSETTSTVVSQRLVRRLCAQCKGSSCFLCEGTGLKGRTGVFEILPIDRAMGVLVRDGARPDALQSAAVGQGFVPLAVRALELVSQGVTSIEEVRRVFGDALEGLRVAAPERRES